MTVPHRNTLLAAAAGFAVAALASAVGAYLLYRGRDDFGASGGRRSERAWHDTNTDVEPWPFGATDGEVENQAIEPVTGARMSVIR